MSYRDELLRQNLEIPYSENTAILAEPLLLSGKKVPNRIGIQPLEGFDSEPDGSPSPYVYRRYLRFVEGGSGLIWFEACAVSEDGKSNPYQMMLTDDNVDAFRTLIQAMDRKAEELGREHTYKILQLTHSGRTSRDENWERTPLSPKKNGEEDQAVVASDERIEKMVQEHIHAAVLAAEAGFDAVDVKVCHGYFLSEMLSAFEREGKYGGSFENRVRAILEIVDGIRAQVGEKVAITVRLNAFDAEPAPKGYGIAMENGRKSADLAETIRLCCLLRDHGVALINISGSGPSQHLFGEEPEDPKYNRYKGSCDLLMAVKLLREKVDGVHFMATGLSAFGAQGGCVAAGGVETGWFDIAGFGRQGLAYPAFASDILEEGAMDADRCCVGCNQCFSLMDPGHTRAGCIVRDREEYFPLYRRYVLGKEE